MYLMVPEDDMGMWWDDPIASEIRDIVRADGLKKWPHLPAGVTLVFYRCDQVEEITQPTPPNRELIQGEVGKEIVGY